MTNWLHTLRVLLSFDLTAVVRPVSPVVVMAVVVEIGLRVSPWSRHPEPALLLFELVAMLVVVSLAAVISRTQAGDLTKGRPRHLFSLPVSPAQVLLSKLAACGVVSVLILSFLNGVWIVGSGDTGPLGGFAAALRLTGDQWLSTMMIWALMLFTLRVSVWPLPVLVTLSLIAGDTIPRSLHPMSLVLPLEAAGHPLFWSRVITSLAIVAVTASVERHIALRVVD